MRKEILIVALLMNATLANILELNNFRLASFILTKKQDFTYSSGAQDEDYSAVRFDLGLSPMNTNQTQNYALMIITADQTQS